MVTPPLWDNLPTDCRSRPQWVIWSHREVHGRKTKVPLDAYGHNASTTAPHTWAHLDEVRKTFEAGTGAGVGFVFTRQAGISGVDLDHCRDPSTGEIDTWAQTIIAQLDSYTEISPSGAGVHILIKGSLPEGTDGKKKTLKGDGYQKDAAVEIYSAGRYFTMTGDVLPGQPQSVESRQDQLTALYSELFGPVEPDTTKTGRKAQDEAEDKPTGGVEGDTRSTTAGNTSTTTGNLSDQTVLARMLGGACADKIEALLNGDTSAYGGDDSAADQALCNHLAFWCRKDQAQMDRIFRSSRLMRPKWDEKRGRQTYGEITINKACQDTPEVYQPEAEAQDTWDQVTTDKAADIVNSGRFIDHWTEVYSRRHNGDSHIAVAMPAANLTANIINSHGIAVVQVAGESGDGKSHAVEAAAEQMGRWCDISGLSPKALLYHGGKTVVEGMMVVLDDNRPDETQADIVKRNQTRYKTGYKYKTVINGKPVVLQMPPGVQLLTTEVDADSEDQVLNRTLLLEVAGSLEKDLKIIAADLKSLETGERPLDDPDIKVCQAAFDLLKSKSYVVTIPGGESRITWHERSKDKRANLRNYNIFRDLILAYAVMQWPQRPHQVKNGVVHVEASRQDFMDALALYHTVHKQMKTKLGSKEIEVLNYVSKRGGRVSREDVMKDLKLSKVRLTQLVRGKNGQSGLLGKVSGFYTEKASESRSMSGGDGYYDPKISRLYLCLSDTAVYQADLSSTSLAATWTELDT